MEADTGLAVAPEETGSEEEASVGIVEAATEPSDEGRRENRREEFDRLIRSDYKAEFDERVKRIIDRRFKETKTLRERAERVKPLMEALERKYGESDENELMRRIAQDEGAGGEHAREIMRDVSVQKTLEGWRRDAEGMKNADPGFDLRSELRDTRFRNLLKSGVDMRTAYDCVHLNERLENAVRVACEKTRENTVSTIRARGFRPDENGAEGRGGRGVSPPDVSRMTRREREQIEKRCARGEKVYF